MGARQCVLLRRVEIILKRRVQVVVCNGGIWERIQLVTMAGKHRAMMWSGVCA